LSPAETVWRASCFALNVLLFLCPPFPLTRQTCLTFPFSFFLLFPSTPLFSSPQVTSFWGSTWLNSRSAGPFCPRSPIRCSLLFSEDVVRSFFPFVLRLFPLRLPCLLLFFLGLWCPEFVFQNKLLFNNFPLPLSLLRPPPFEPLKNIRRSTPPTLITFHSPWSKQPLRPFPLITTNQQTCLYLRHPCLTILLQVLPPSYPLYSFSLALSPVFNRSKATACLVHFPLICRATSHIFFLVGFLD